MSRPSQPLIGARFGDDWWRRGVVYQVYPRSFADSTGDGVGDLPGIIDHLDHLGPDGLGVDAIWLSPIYPSPGLDLGYDVSDHARVDPMFGTEEDFDRLVGEAHRRGIRVVLDLVMNHTSNVHPWFIASRSDPAGPYADWYLWSDPAATTDDGDRLAPNNWLSWFGGSGWTWVPERGQSYYHMFLAEQPDLDWRTPAVEAAQFDMVRGWLARGVDGFRLDVFNAFLKDPDLPSNPMRRGTSPWTNQRHVHDRDQPDLPDLLGRFRSILDEAPGRMSVGELFDGEIDAAAKLTTDRHLVFDWELIGTAWTAGALRSALARRESVFGPDRWPTAVLSNHDQPRHASRFADSIRATDREPIAKAAAVLSLTVRGTPFLYYGEEIGMGDVAIPPDERMDLAATRMAPGTEWWERSPCRTPMPWTDGPGAGFTTGRPWLRLGDDTDSRNVHAQSADPDSVLACYRRLIAARAGLPSLQSGGMTLLATMHPDVVAYRRGEGAGAVVVVLNLGAEVSIDKLELDPGALRPVVGTHRQSPAATGGSGSLTLRAGEAVVLAREDAGSI